jgi:hypothetical protein
LGIASRVFRLELVTRLVAIGSVTVRVKALYVGFCELALCLKSKDLLRAVVVAALLGLRLWSGERILCARPFSTLSTGALA